MSIKQLGINVFQVDTVAKHELGLEAMDIKGGSGILSFRELLPASSAEAPGGAGVPAGGQAVRTTIKVYDPSGIYRYVRANAAGIAAGDGVTSDPAANGLDKPNAVIQTAGANAILEGVAMSDIPSGSFGWIQIRGKHFNVNVPDSVAADALLDTAAGGAFATQAATSEAQSESLIFGCRVRKIANQTVVYALLGLTGVADRGVCVIR